MALVAAARAGDERAFEALYARYQRRVFAYVLSMVGDYGRAEDVTQEVFISALRRMRSTARPIVFKPWVYEIAKNACIDAYRRSRRGEEVSYDASEHFAASDRGSLASTIGAPERAVEVKQRMEHLRRAFGGLSQSHHEILVLRELEGLSYHEIGERMGLSRPSVESTLFRARRRLTEEYDELESGRRCQRVQGIIATASGTLSLRERRRLASHLGVCPACRREARLAGLDAVAAGRGGFHRVAALLPLPPFLLRRINGGATAGSGTRVGAHTSDLAHAAAGLGPMLEPAGALSGKTLAVVVSLAVATAGASVAVDHGARPAHRTPAPTVRQSHGPQTPASAPARGVPSASALVPAAHSTLSSAHRARLLDKGGRSIAASSSRLPSPASPRPASRPQAPGAGGGSTGAAGGQPSSPDSSRLPSLPARAGAALGGVPLAVGGPGGSAGVRAPLLAPSVNPLTALTSVLGAANVETTTRSLTGMLVPPAPASDGSGGAGGTPDGG